MQTNDQPGPGTYNQQTHSMSAIQIQNLLINEEKTNQMSSTKLTKQRDQHKQNLQ